MASSHAGRRSNNTLARVPKDKALWATEERFIHSLRIVIDVRYKDLAHPLWDFGMAPAKKRAPASAEQQLLAAAKNRATRVERRTMGKKQKKAIKGNVTGVVITPVMGAKKGTE